MTYNWNEMKKIELNEALLLWKHGKEVYCLHEDGTESLVTSESTFQDHSKYGGEFGIEK